MKTLPITPETESRTAAIKEVLRNAIIVDRHQKKLMEVGQTFGGQLWMENEENFSSYFPALIIMDLAGEQYDELACKLGSSYLEVQKSETPLFDAVEVIWNRWNEIVREEFKEKVA